MKPLHQRLTLCVLFVSMPSNRSRWPRYTDGNETYTFVPAEPVGARSMTIYRNSGDIVLNGAHTFCAVELTLNDLRSPQCAATCDLRAVGEDDIWHLRAGLSRNVYAVPSSHP